MMDAAAVLLLVGKCLLRLRRGGLQDNMLFHCCVRTKFTGLVRHAFTAVQDTSMHLLIECIMLQLDYAVETGHKAQADLRSGVISAHQLDWHGSTAKALNASLSYRRDQGRDVITLSAMSIDWLHA